MILVRMKPQPVQIIVDGETRSVTAGQSLAAALLSLGVVTLRRSPRAGAARGPFCMMGVCQECIVRVDGARRQACMQTVRDGMSVALHAV